MFAPLHLLLQFIIGAIEFFLGLKFLLRLLGANANAPFVQWIYEMAATLEAPFANIFPATRIEGYVFDFTTLFALFIYVLMGYFITEILAYIDFSTRRRNHRE